MRNVTGPLIALLIFYAFGVPGQSGRYFPGTEWRRSSPASQGLDTGKINEFVEKLAQLQRPISSFVVIRNGFLVVEEYFGSYNPDRPHTLQSVTKSITSTLVGVALQSGFIEDIDQPILEFFPEYNDIENMDDYKRSMSLRHALTMQTGQAWTGERHLDALNSFRGDKMKYVLDYDMEGSPGKKWYYNSGIAILLGGLLQNATGISTKDLSRDYLFTPLGITSGTWSWGHRGIPHTGGGLYLTPVDLARVGYLYLQDGVWNGKRILPEGWVREATRPHVLHAETIAGVKMGYGYMWWLLPKERDGEVQDPAEVFMAYGHWGQFLFVAPEYNMILVFTNNSSATYGDEINPIRLFYQHVLSAVQDNR